MDAYKVVVLFVLATVPVVKVCEEQNNDEDAAFSGIAFEMLLTKLEYLQDKLVEMESLVKETDRNLSIAINQAIDHKLSRVNDNIGQLSTTLAAIKAQSNETKQITNAKFEEVQKELRNLASRKDLAWVKVDPDTYYRNNSFPSCKEDPSNRSSKYLIQPAEYTKPFMGYCEQTAFGGGWLVFQYRYDGSVDFYRNWAEYRDGFGTLDGEFWLGLEYLHRLTTARPHELLVELKDFSGKYLYARYSEFEIGNEEEGYLIHKLGQYNGTVVDSFYGRKQKFVTKDRDPDEQAKLHHGAWWADIDVIFANLNGRYLNATDCKSMYWYGYKFECTGLAYSRMSIRKI